MSTRASLLALLVLAHCHRDATPVATARPAPVQPEPHTDPGRAPAPIVRNAPPVSDAPADVDLLHQTDAIVTVSSEVQNPTDHAANLVDGNLETAWSSRTGELAGAEIDVRVPDDATVDEIRMTVGMTRRTDAGDLFTENPRIATVHIWRGLDDLGNVRLDRDRRDLQSIPIHRGGGAYRVVVSEVVPGSHQGWREVSVSEFQVMGHAPHTNVSVPTVRIGRMIPDRMPTQPFELPNHGGLPGGCLAWSAREHAAACVVGFHGSNLPVGSEDDPSGAAWSVRFLGADGVAPIDALDHTDAGFPPSPADVPLAAATAAQLRSRLGSGGYVMLNPLGQVLTPGIPAEWSQGLAVRFNDRRTYAGGDNAAPRYTSSIEIRWPGSTAWQTMHAWNDEPVDGPEVNVYAIPGGRYLVVDSDRAYGDEGMTGHVLDAWLCDTTARACRNE